MSFLGIGRPQPTSEQKIAAVEGEMRMMADTYNRLQKTCQKKCVPSDYREGDLNKGESVCLDRCTAKFLDTSMKISEIMQQQGQAMGGGPQGGGPQGGGPQGGGPQGGGPQGGGPQGGPGGLF